MKTSLHVKLRAARKAAGMTQEQLAKRLGVTRGAVTQWESKNLETRTQPSINLLNKASEIMQVPASWLIDQHSSDTDVQQVRDSFNNSNVGNVNIVKGHGGMDAVPPPSDSVPVNDRLPRLARSFWKSAEFELLKHQPNAERYFDIQIEGTIIDFATTKDVAHFIAAGVDVHAAIGKLLLAERLVGSEVSKHLLVFTPQGAGLPAAVRTLCQRAGVTVHQFREPVDAAKFLLRLIRQ